MVKPLTLPSIISSGCLPVHCPRVGSLPSQDIRPSHFQMLGPHSSNISLGGLNDL